MNSFFFTVLTLLHRLVRGTANRILPKHMIRPREFSNAMLRQYGPYFRGRVVNVSGWKDEDGEGGTYRSYFTGATSYAVTNVAGQGKGFGSAEGYEEIELDLERELPSALHGAFDVVFNHTTLEHIFDFRKAFANLCALSRDTVILVVPVLQQIHHTADFGDYWRPTTMAVAKLFVEHGFEPLVITTNDQPFAPVYCFAIASKTPSKYVFPKRLEFNMGAYNYGSSLEVEHVHHLIGS